MSSSRDGNSNNKQQNKNYIEKKEGDNLYPISDAKRKFEEKSSRQLASSASIEQKQQNTLDWDTLRYIERYTDSLLECLARNIERYTNNFLDSFARNADLGNEFWILIDSARAKDAKHPVIIFERKLAKCDTDFAQYETTLGQLASYKDALQKLQLALKEFKTVLKGGATATPRANEAFQVVMQCLKDTIHVYNRLHENILSGPAKSTKKPTALAAKISTPYQRTLLIRGHYSELYEAPFLEIQYLISVFLGLCHAEIRAKNEAKLDLSYVPSLEWDALKRIHKQAVILESMLREKLLGHELVSLLHYFNQYFSDEELHAYHSRNDEPLRRADHSLRYLMVYMKSSRDNRVRTLLEFEPFIRLEQREKADRLHQLHYDMTSKMRWCAALRNKHALLVRKVRDTQSEHARWHHLLSDQLITTLNREEILSRIIAKIQSLLSPELVEELALFRLAEISKPIEAKFSMPPLKKAKLDVSALPAAPIFLAELDAVPVSCDLRIRNNEINSIYQLHHAYEIIEIYYDQLNAAVSHLQQQLAHMNEASNLSDCIMTLAKAAQRLPRPNERKVRAMQLIAENRQKSCSPAALPVLQNISKIAREALHIPLLATDSPLLPEESVLPELGPLPVTPLGIKEKKQEQLQLDIMDTNKLDWEGLLFLSRDAFLNLSRDNRDDSLRVSSTSAVYPQRAVDGLMPFEAYVYHVHLEHASLIPEAKRQEALKLLRNTLPPAVYRWSGASRQWQQSVCQEIELALGYEGQDVYFNWEELHRFNILVRLLQESHKKLPIGWSSIGKLLHAQIAQVYEANPFIMESYYFTEWFNKPKPYTSINGQSLSLRSRQERPMREGYPYHGQPVRFTRNAVGLARLHRDLYRFVNGLQLLDPHRNVTGNQSSSYLADYPEIAVCLHTFRSMMMFRLRELREDYALAYERNQRLQLNYKALEKEYAQLDECETVMDKQITQKLREGLDREKACAATLSRIGAFPLSSPVARNVMKEAKVFMPVSALTTTIVLFGREDKTASPQSSQLLLSSGHEISSPTMNMLDWTALDQIYQALCETGHEWDDFDDSRKIGKESLSALPKLKKKSYWLNQNKENDRQVLVKLGEYFSSYLKPEAKRDETQLQLANRALINFIDRIDCSPYLADFVNDVTQLYHHFLAQYNATVLNTLRDAHAKHQQIQNLNRSLTKEIATLKARISAKKADIFSEKRLRSGMKNAVATVMSEPRPQEFALTVVGFMSEQARQRNAAQDVQADFEKIVFEVRKILK